MTLVTRTLLNTGEPLTAPDGTLLANVAVTFTLVSAAGRPGDVWDATTHERVVGVVSTVTDESAHFTVSLWPNSRGNRPTQYLCHVDHEAVRDFRASVPTGDTTLSWVEFMAGGQALTAQQLNALEMHLADNDGAHMAGAITEDSTHRFATDTEKTAWNAKQAPATTLAGYGITDAATSVQGAKADTAVQPTRTINGHALSADVTVSKADVGLGSAEDKSSATIRGELTSGNVTGALGFTPENAANKSTDVVADGSSDTKYPSAKAVKTYADAGDAAILSSANAHAESLVVGLLDDRGNFGAAGNAFPTTGGSGTAGAILKGDLWTISVAGTLGGHAVTAGDLVRALVDAPGATDGNWAITENNFGYVAENVANKDTDGALTANSDTKFASQKATKTYADNRYAAAIQRGNHTGTQLAATISDFASTVLATTLTGFSTATATAVTAADTILVATGKLQGQITAQQAGVNNIGVPGQQGFGAGIAPSLPAGFAGMYGTNDPASDNYGNYQYSDGSVMVYIPAFYYKYGTGANGLALNVVDVKPFAAYADVATANAAGYALHRAFYNAGTIRPGVFVDKHLCSNNSGVASSLKNGIPLASAQRGGIASTAFATLNGAPANNYGGALAAAKTRGASFFCSTRFIRSALALLANAHGSASAGTAYNAWYSAGSTNFPKGCNNNALGDANDGTIAYTDDGTATNCGKTGSANFFAKTTHNGQACGVADLNGVLWTIEPGLTSDGALFYLLNTAADANALTGGNALATDAWGATGLAALYTSIGATYAALTASATNKVFGAAAQVLSEATGGTAWAAAGAGIPLLAGVGGSNQFGSDYMYDARPNELCVISGGSWNNGGSAGVWALLLGTVRGSSDSNGGFRSASYL